MPDARPDGSEDGVRCSGAPARLTWDDPATGRRVELRLTPHRNPRKQPQ